jgi:hypothetical protein
MDVDGAFYIAKLHYWSGPGHNYNLRAKWQEMFGLRALSIAQTKNTVTPKRTGYQSQETMYIQLIGHDRPCEFNLIQKTVSGNTNMIQCTHARDWHVPPEGVFEGFTIQKVRSQEIHVATFRRTSVAKLDNGKTYIRLDNQPTLVFQVEPFLGQVARPDETRPDETTSINSWIRTTQARNTEKRFPDLS